MKRSWTSYARYILAAALLYLVFGWTRERLANEKPDCPIGQSATQDSDKTWRCMCNEPTQTLIGGVCQDPPKVNPMDPKTWVI